MHLETYLYPHILGGLYGQALGDAWGMPAYLRPAQTWAYYNGWIETLLDAPPDHPIHAGFKAGQVTDDTQQALALAQSIITAGEVTVEGVAKALVAWYDAIDGESSSFVGPSTRQAVNALKAGANPNETGLRGDTNGGAMRICPVGLIHPGDPVAAVEDAVIACTPSHFTDIAVSGACAVAAAIAQALVPNATLEEIIKSATWGAEVGLQRGVPWMGASVARKIEFAVQLATDATVSESDRIQNLYDLVGSTLAVADSIPCAFGVLAMAEGDLVDTAIYAAALSGDADTVGAMAGAMAGAWQGVDAIPLEYIEMLRLANPQYDFEEIAEGLFAIALRNHSDTPQTGQHLLDSIRNEGADDP
jgi:ADP-ribosylglycohydrolase